MSGAHGPKDFKFDAARVFTIDDFDIFSGFSMTQFLPYEKIMLDEKKPLETILATQDDV